MFDEYLIWYADPTDNSLIFQMETPFLRKSSVHPMILLATFLYGEQGVRKRLFRLFCESARLSGIELVIVGHPAPLFELPPNVRHVPVTWDQLVDRLRDGVLNGTEPTELRGLTEFYKVNDFKPLFAHLFPELVQGYDWWGTMDNDMILGNWRKFLTPYFLSQYDLIAGHTFAYTAGHLTLYRNTPLLNQLFLRSSDPPAVIFASAKPYAFDEWGTAGGTHTFFIHYNNTMSGIVDHHRESLGIRTFGLWNYVWDGDWYNKSHSFAQVTLMRDDEDGRGEQKQALVQTCYSTHHDCNGEVMFVHFQESKAITERVLKNNNTLFQALIDRGEYRVDFLKGPSLLPDRK